MPPPQRIAKRPGDRLLLLEIGCQIDIGCGDEAGQSLQVKELVVEHHVRLDPEPPHPLQQPVPVLFSTLSQDVWVGRTKHDVHGVRVHLRHRRHRVDGVLDPLAGPQQAKGQDHLPVLHAELVLVVTRIHKRDVGDAMGDHGDLVFGHVVDISEHVTATPTHHDQGIREPAQLADHGSLLGRRPRQHCVQGGQKRHSEILEQEEDVRPRPAAEDAELVLQDGHVDAADVQKLCRAKVVARDVVVDLKLDAFGVVIALLDIVHG